MNKTIISLFFIIIFTACNSSKDTTDTTTDTEINNSDYIASIPTDTVVNDSVARVLHHNSTIPMLVILLSYKNQVIASSESAWSQKLFGNSQHQLNNYYYEASNGQFQFTKANESYATANDGVVSVTLNKNHPNINIDSSLFATSVYPDLAAALKVIDPYINFSDYDTNGNGHITPDELLLTFIIAGYEDAYEGRHVTNGVWAHQFCMENPLYAPTLDGVDLMRCQNSGNFALFGEKHDYTQPHDATIGIIAHELGHSTFSLPDLYNTAGDYGGIGYFGLMGSGTWAVQNNREYPGNTPTHFTAWSKTYIGWTTPHEQTGYCLLNASSSVDYNVVKIPISANNYYLLENRHNSGYDKGLYSLTGVFNGGIAIWHVNENKLTVSNFELNNVNTNTTSKGLDLVEAANPTLDTEKNGGGDVSALFYSPSINTFGDKVTDISSPGLQMSLTIN